MTHNPGTPLERLEAALNDVVLGQRAAVADVLAAFLARGHVLIEGVPGVAKTLLARACAGALGLIFHRVQFTPDLMPSDLLGTSVFRPEENGFRLIRGPIFTQVLVADEINRTPPKTQAALLEAMEERQVTLDGKTHPLDPSFFVVATQNPLELEGTYPLPEAQLDRFLMRVRIGYPDLDAEKGLLAAFHGRKGRPPQVASVVSPQELAGLQENAASVSCDPSILEYAVNLVRETRVHPQVRLGASPRSAQSLLAAAKARAALQQRAFVVPDDVKAVLGSVLNHRLILKAEAEVDGVTADDVLTQTLSRVPVPAVIRGLPVPTLRFLALLALGIPAMVFSAALPGVRTWVLAYDALLAGVLFADYLLAPDPRRLEVTREVAAVLSAGVPQPVELRIHFPGRVALRGEIRDVAPPGMQVQGARQRFSLPRDAPHARLRYSVESSRRGDFRFGDAHLRLEGPLGLCTRQSAVPLAQDVRVFPNLSALSRDALALARASEEWAKRPLRRMGEGSEFESLRPWAAGDDVRRVDWKVSARRGQPIVRVYQPERNQVVLLLLDCGRHMAGMLQGRRKLDHAVDAALRVARVSLDAGDAVGLLAFGSDTLAHLGPRRGREQLKTLTRALYRVEAQLTESDYGLALDRAFRHRSRRALVVVFTDLLDRETSAALVRRTLALLPRHLPVIVSLLDEDLESAAHAEPKEVHDAYVRHVAAGLDEEYRLNASRLQAQGARVVRALPAALGAAAVSEYLFVKGRGLL